MPDPQKPTGPETGTPIKICTTDLPPDTVRYKVPGGWIYEIAYQYDREWADSLVGVNHVFVPYPMGGAIGVQGGPR